ncbi:hypothetical protein V3C99_004032 [Haemonchus contortus]
MSAIVRQASKSRSRLHQKSASRSPLKNANEAQKRSKSNSGHHKNNSDDSSDESPAENKQALKKLIHRVKESVGIAQRTRYSDKLCDEFEQLDNYKQCLDRLNWSLCQAIQGNPSFLKHGNCLAPPPDEDPYELIAELLKNNDIFKDIQNHDTQVSLYEKQAVEHREYIKEARHALHNIRKFIVKEYPAIGVQRKELDDRRREMDFAKAELKAVNDSESIEQKNKSYNEAVKVYEEKLKEVEKRMEEVLKKKEVHLAEVIEWTNRVRQYHEKMSKILKDS